MRAFVFKLSKNGDVGMTLVVVSGRALKSPAAYLPLAQFPKRKSSLVRAAASSRYWARLLNNRDGLKALFARRSHRHPQPCSAHYVRGVSIPSPGSVHPTHTTWVSQCCSGSILSQPGLVTNRALHFEAPNE